MEIDNISNYINYKLHEHKTHLIIFINDDYETKKLKTKQYIYKNRKLIIFGFIIAVLLAYITHLENNCNYQPHKQYGGTVTGAEQKPTTSYKLQRGGGGEGSPNDPEPKVASEGGPKPVTTKAADETKTPTAADGTKTPASGAADGTKTQHQAAEGTKTSQTEGGQNQTGSNKKTVIQQGQGQTEPKKQEKEMEDK
jgi:hypothetical protein